MSHTQFCFSVRQAEAGLRSSLQKVAVGQPPIWADRVRSQSGLRPERKRPGHGSRCTAVRARSVPSPSAPSPALTLSDFGYEYDAAGNRTQKSTLDYTEDYGYDPLYRLTRTDRTNPGATPPNQWTWNYDAVGNRTSAQKDSEATTSTHNEKNQLLNTTGGGKMLWRGTLDEPGTASFSGATINGQPARMLAGNVFEATLDLPAGANNVTIQAQDGSGNIATNVYSVNVIGVPSSYTYDANGNLSAKTEGADSWTYTWNALNQLTAVTKNNVSAATYEFDPVGRRATRIASGVTTSWLYDRKNVIRQSTGASQIVRFLHGPIPDEPLGSEDALSNSLSYLHADGLGSIVSHTSTGGAILVQLAYDAWGRIETAEPLLYGFTGREWDSQASLWYYRNRWYDAQSGRFLSEDPAGLGADLLLYRYTRGNPVNHRDPSGLRVYASTFILAPDYNYDGRYGPWNGYAGTRWLMNPGEPSGCVCRDGAYAFDIRVHVDIQAVYASPQIPMDASKESPGKTVEQHESGHESDLIPAVRLLDAMTRTEGFGTMRECQEARRFVKLVLAERMGFFDGVSHDLRDVLR